MESGIELIARAWRQSLFTTCSTDQKAHVRALKIAPEQADNGVCPIELTEQPTIQVANQICPDIFLFLHERRLASGHALKYAGIDQSKQKLPVGTSQRVRGIAWADPLENLRIEQRCG